MLKEEIQTEYRVSPAVDVKVSDSYRIECSADAAKVIKPDFLADSRTDNQEILKVYALDNKNTVIASQIVAVGTISGVCCEPSQIFKFLILKNAARFILAHNHPSGDPTPSPADKALTSRLIECGELLGVSLLDHIVLGAYCNVSFRDFGFMSEPK